MLTRRTILAGLLYGGMLLAAVGWAAWGGRSLIHGDGVFESSRATLMATSALGGLFIAALVIALSRHWVRNARWAQQLHVSFRGLLGPLSGAEIAFFAVASGIAEEAFFRGAMQPVLGWIPTALVFGFAHVPPTRRFLPWTGFAIVMGLVLGGLYALTGEIVGVVLAHILINYENLHFIEAYDPEMPDSRTVRSVSPPSLVGNRSTRVR